MGKTNIGWTEATWNPVVGCTRCSPGCGRCYAFTLHDQRHEAHRRGKSVPPQYARPFKEVQLVPDRIDDPLHWIKPRMVFVNSMSDLFHEDVPDDYVLRVFDTMRRCTWAGGQGCGRIGGDGHTFQVLTKRAERMRDFMGRLRWDGEKLVLDKAVPGGLHSMLKQIWLGVSVENQEWADRRMPHLLATPAAVRFISVEPLLGPIEFDANLHNLYGGIHWAIVGGESGGDRRPCEVEWFTNIVRQCDDAGVRVFVKQDGAHAPGKQGRLPGELWARKELPLVAGD